MSPAQQSRHGVTRRRCLLALWMCGMTLVITLPWSTLQDYAQWERVRWVLFMDTAFNPRDIGLNVVAFLPFGFLLGSELAERRRLDLVWWVVVSAALLSMTGEIYQLFNPRRYPTTIDIASNTVGAYLGLWMSRARAGL